MRYPNNFSSLKRGETRGSIFHTLVALTVVLFFSTPFVTLAQREADVPANNTSINSSAEESHEYTEITDGSYWGLGFFNTFFPGTDITSTIGYQLSWAYEMRSYAAEVEARFVPTEDKERNLGLVVFSVGGTYFSKQQDISPYVRGGLIAGSAYREKIGGLSTTYEFEGGMGVYIAGGIQMLRSTWNRLKLELRIDSPFFSFPNQTMIPITIGFFMLGTSALAKASTQRRLFGRRRFVV